ncbi:MAG: hypothetical protein IJ643_04050, partial [Eubacterium sp.]|nr:hypothetical protein [Eubacterium sp.]
MYGIKFVILDAWEGNPENCKFNVQIWIKPRRGLSYAYAGIGRFCKDEADVEEYKKSILDAYYLRPRITGNDGDIE